MIRVGTVLRQFALTLLVGCGMICFGGSICVGQAAANPADTVQIPNPPQSLSSGAGRSLARSTSAPIIKHRIKDITRLSSDRTNRLSGLGLVLGLGNGGSKSADTAQALRNYYKNNEIIIEDVAEGGAALVTVSLDVPANYRPGEKLIGTVAASDESTSLYGGVLVSTILRVYPDGEGYAVASGPLTVGGFSVGGEGASVTKNHPTKAKVSVQIERKLQNESPFSSKTFDLLLLNKDRSTAVAIEEAINAVFPGASKGLDSGVVQVCFPAEFEKNKLKFVSQIERLKVLTDSRAVVVINESTGSIVIGKHVKLSTFTFGYEDLIVTVNETPIVSQPPPFSGGTTEVLELTEITATESGGDYKLMAEQPTVQDLQNLLNQLGVPPRDLIPILEQAARLGALQAELVLE